MRLFAAISPPDAVKDHLAGALASALGPGTDRSAPLSPRQNWHITLAFYGEVPDCAGPVFEQALAAVLPPLGAFRLELAGAGVIRRRVGWIGVGGQTATLKRAMAAAADLPGPAGGLTTGPADAARSSRRAAARQPRALRPHLTITRAADHPAISPALTALSVYRGPSWLVNAVELIVSEVGRGPGGHALHTPVATVPLP
ncbi:MAG: 2'-5' RNA ligase family protein [Bifidobacteriaceae bacterium]|jgi:2'-5' RNA ligase|nr:2'-5' RNA ligase family protein [Bifidobacteriaceae bacterium]